MKSIEPKVRILGLLVCALLALGGAAGAAQPGGSVDGARLVGTTPLQGELFHVQGVDLDDRHIWVTSVDLQNHQGFIHEFDRNTGAFVRRVELTDGVRFHPGGFSIQGGSIWVPVAEMRPDSSAVLEELDKRTLAVRRKIPVADHVGCVTVIGHHLIAGNWDSRRFYVLDKKGKQLRLVSNPFATRYQDIKFTGGRLVASGLLTSTDGTIDWISWPSMKLLASRHAGPTDRGKAYTSEGMALKGRDLYLIPEDGPSRLFHFRIEGDL